MPAPRVALFGGTFDPPHLGHLVCAAEVLDAGGFDEVLLVVSNDPWQKRRPDLTPADIRLEMVEAAVAGHPGLTASDLEIRRGGATYTVDTVTELRTARPDAEISVIVGADAASRVDTWHRAEELATLVDLVVLPRPGEAVPAPPPPWRSRLVDVPQIGISSTEVRARRAAGRSIDFLVPDVVRAIIERRSLYGERP